MSDDHDPPAAPEDELPPPVPPEARHPGFVGTLRRHRIDLTPLKESADFRRLFVGQALSEFGTQITFVAVPLQLYVRTRSTAMVGLLALCETLPLVVLPLVGGAIADAVERRRFLMFAQAIAAVLCSLGLAVNAFLRHPKIWVLFAFSFLWASAYSLYSPAFRAWPARLLTPDLCTSALALEVVYYQLGGAGRTRGRRRRVRGARGGVRVPDRCGQLPGRHRCARRHAAVAADSRTRVRRLVHHRGGPPIPAREPGAPGHVLDRLVPATIFGLPVALYPAFVYHVLPASPAVVGVLYSVEGSGGAPRRLGERPGQTRPASGAGRRSSPACAGVPASSDSGWPGPSGSPSIFLMLAERLRHGQRSLPRNCSVPETVTPDEMRGRLEGSGLAVVGTGPSLGNAEAGLLASVTSVLGDLDRVRWRREQHHRRRYPRPRSFPGTAVTTWPNRPPSGSAQRRAGASARCLGRRTTARPAPP